jgi:ribonuclease HI
VLIREYAVADLPSRPTGDPVIIYADGVGGPAPGPGGLGTVLMWRDRVQEICDCRWGTTDDRMNLLAAVRALERLKRPVSVQVWIDNDHVRTGVTQLLSERQASRWPRDDSELRGNIDLWVRLAAAVKLHEVEWIWAGEDISEPGYKRAVELARQGLETALNGEPSGAGNSFGEIPAEQSSTLARLAALISIQKHCDPVTVWEHLQDITAKGTVLPDPIAEIVTALEEGDGNRLLDSYTAISRDPVLARMVSPPRRRSQRSEVVTYRVRIDLRNTKPPVWRRLELASDLFLDDVHEVVQTAFGWTGSHLHMFSSGSSAYSPDAEYYLCPYGVAEGEVGIPEQEVRLDEVLVDAGDKMYYMYDFGDSWEYLIRLEAVLPRDSSAPQAICTAGRRAGPEEDCGGVRAYESMVAADPDEDIFTESDIELINEELN